MRYELKPRFEERMRKLIPDYDKFIEFSGKESPNSIRCNTLKISPEELKQRLEEKGWKVEQPFIEHKEIMIIGKLNPGELGKSVEHLLGYYYVQEISSMLPIIALNPQPDEILLDLCAAPGSKTTQAAMVMKNSGTIIANDKEIGRIRILNSNIERCSCSNVIMTRHDGVQLCERLKKLNMKFDKILLDVPCSGEGNIRSNPKTLLMWNENMIKKLSRIQKKLIASAICLLKPEGELVYSTCTHAPEEDEENVNFLAEKFNMEIIPVHLPVKCRRGISEWEGKTFPDEIKNCCRVYPQDNDTEGFFLAKLRFRK